jgi:hypothetical protein
VRNITLRMFKNRVLRRIFEPKRDEVIESWRKLHNEELYNLYFSLNKVRMMELKRMRGARNVACMGEKMNSYWILM